MCHTVEKQKCMPCSFSLKVHMRHLCIAHITIRMWFPGRVKQDAKLCISENREKKNRSLETQLSFANRVYIKCPV